MAGVLLFGGSFDPIHNGHLIIARHVARRIQADRTILIPAAIPPHKLNRQLAPAEMRLEMCRAATASDAGFAVSDWELHQAGPNYTLLTVRHFRGEFPPSIPLFWLIGLDSLAELSTWYCVANLVEECAIVTAGRPGVDGPRLDALNGLIPQQRIDELRSNIIDTPLIDISSTEIRSRARNGLPLTDLVPAEVEKLIRSTRVYG